MIGIFQQLYIISRRMIPASLLVLCIGAGPGLAQHPEPELEAPRPHYPSQTDVARPTAAPSVTPANVKNGSRSPASNLAIPSGRLTPAVKPRRDVAQSTDTEFNRFLTKLALKHLPAEFEEDKDWGQTAERWDGIKFRRDNGRLETERRRKTVNHGTWKKYSAELANPAEQFSIEIKDLRELQNNQIGFSVHCAANVNLDARQSKWIKGIQLYSLSAQGHARMRLEVEMQVTMTTDPGKFPPDLVFQPEATSATIHLDEFRIDRVSKLGGEFAQQVSRAVRKQLDRKIEDKQQKLVDKINREIEDNRDQLRVPVGDLLGSQWSKLSELLKTDDIAQRSGSEKN